MSAVLPPSPAPVSVPGPPSLRSAVLGFCIDLLIAIGLLLLLSVAGFAVWGFLRSMGEVQAVRAQGGSPSRPRSWPPSANRASWCSC